MFLLPLAGAYCLCVSGCAHLSPLQRHDNSLYINTSRLIFSRTGRDDFRMSYISVNQSQCATFRVSPRVLACSSVHRGEADATSHLVVIPLVCITLFRKDCSSEWRPWGGNSQQHEIINVVTNRQILCP